MDVSIILVNFNGAQTVLDCLDSVFLHTRDIRYEVVVVDNASTDGSAEAIRSRYPKALFIQSPDNEGFSRGCNRAIAASKGRLVLLLNTDTVLKENAVKGMADFLDANPRAGIAGCMLLNGDGTYQKSTGRTRSILNELGEKWVRSGLERQSRAAVWLEQSFARRIRPVGWVSGAFLMIRRAVIDTIGLLDERMFLCFEDIDWCIRAAKAGWQVLYNPHVRVIHLGGASMSKNLSTSLVAYRRSQLLYYRIHHGSGPDTQILRLFFILKALYGFASTGIPTLAGSPEQRQERARRRQLCRELLHLALRG